MKQDVLGRVSGGIDLTQEVMFEAMTGIMAGKWSHEEVGLLLLALRAKGEASSEIAGAARCLRENMRRIETDRSELLDTCGTGGDGAQTFNISTAAAIVVAASGLAVAKHGNRSVTSKSGSSEVLRQMGVNIEATVRQVERCLDEIGLCFCYAPLMHPSMKKVAEVRKKLGVPTIFNLLGPLCNPASAPIQLLGVGRGELVLKMAEAVRDLGVSRAVIVHGSDGLDEVTLGGTTRVASTLQGDQTVATEAWEPERFNVARADLTTLRVSSPAESAEVISRVLAGSPGPPRDVVVANAGAALWTAGFNDDLAVCADLAREAIDNGKASRMLAELARISHLN